MIRIYTDRLMIRDHLLSDLDEHHELISDPEVMDFVDSIKSETKDDSLENLRLAMEGVDKPDRKYYFLRIAERTLGKHIGEIGYTVEKDSPRGKFVEIGYFIRKEFWNQGYATEALMAICEFAFNEDNVYRILGTCMKDNMKSSKVLLNAGFVLEGDLKEYQYYKGAYRDRLIFRLLKPEWEAKNI